ncbi:MAG TPA: maleylpyruvate isomerase N-terminal domain-containing protein [Ktedonobacterales bacterium]
MTSPQPHDDDQTREGLLARTREQHARLLALLAPLADDALTRPGVTEPDHWSVKDHLAHLTWWSDRAIALVGGTPEPIEPPSIEDEQADDVNAAVYAMNRDRSLADVRAAFDAGHERLLRFIETLPDDALAEHYGLISGNADGHYDEHVRMLETWQAREQQV